MDIFRVRKIRDSTSTGSTTGTLDSLHQSIVQGLKESKTQQQSLQEELDELRSEISTLYESNTIDNIARATQLQTRLRAIEEELTHAQPVEEYYLKNMDLLDEYYKRADAGATAPAAAPKDANTFMKFFETP